MVLRWLWVRVVDAVFPIFEHRFHESLWDFVESDDGKELIDGIVERQIQRFQGSAGGMMHNPAGGNSQTLITSLIQAVLPNILNKGSNQPITGENPYAKV